MPGLVRALKRMRLMRGMKQSHLAELLSVTQATVSRWERGTLRPSDTQLDAMARLLGAPHDATSDAALKRLVESSARPVHLICDATHRLLAASPARTAKWGVPASELLGRSLWPFASPEIAAAEARLDALGWHEAAAPAIAIRTSANRSRVVPIEPGHVLWERLRLEDGSEARLVTTVAPSQALPEGVLLA